MGMEAISDEIRRGVVVVASDHAGYPLKEYLRGYLFENGYTPVDLGTHTSDSVDYSDYAFRLARGVSLGRWPRGILICGSGIGMSMGANRFRGVRAALVHDLESARLSREHNDANVLVLGGRVTPVDRARQIVGMWLTTSFAGGRHERRVRKLDDLIAEEEKHEETR